MGQALREIQQIYDDKMDAMRGEMETFYNLKVTQRYVICLAWNTVGLEYPVLLEYNYNNSKMLQLVLHFKLVNLKLEKKHKFAAFI